MAVKDLKGWNGESHRWRWLINGERVTVTCAELKLPPTEWTKEKSQKAAHDWKLNYIGHQIVEQEKQHPHAERLAKLIERFQIASDLGIDTAVIKAEIEETNKLPADETAYVDTPTNDKLELAKLVGLNLDGIDPTVLNALFGVETLWQDRKRRSGRVEVSKTIGDNAKRFIDGKLDESRLGTRSPDGADNIRRWLGKFVEHAGSLCPVDAITFDLWERWQRKCKARSNTMQTEEAAKEYQVSKTFVRWLWKQDLLVPPKNLDDKQKFTRWEKDIVTYSKGDIAKTVKLATGQLKLHLLLMLNCGMTQKDISDLRHDQIDFKNGIISRKRSKTQNLDTTPIVSYPLWPSTLTELKKHQSKHPTLALVTKSDQAWCRKETLENGKIKKADNVATLWANMKLVNPNATFLKTLKSFKKSSSTLIFNNPKYSIFHELFLGHSAKGTARRSYSKLERDTFVEAVGWLGKQYKIA